MTQYGFTNVLQCMPPATKTNLNILLAYYIQNWLTVRTGPKAVKGKAWHDNDPVSTSRRPNNIHPRNTTIMISIEKRPRPLVMFCPLEYEFYIFDHFSPILTGLSAFSQYYQLSTVNHSVIQCSTRRTRTCHFTSIHRGKEQEEPLKLQSVGDRGVINSI